MKLTSEADVLNPVIRAKIIDEINGTENIGRKSDMFRRYECLKDKTDYYVQLLLMNQFDQNTVREMQYAISNISVMRKIVDKIAKVYNNGVKRTADSKKKADTQAIEEMANELNLNTKMKKTNKYLVAFRNTLAYVKPYLAEMDTGKYNLCVSPLAPFLYDVVEDCYQPEKPMCVILSNYKPQTKLSYALGDLSQAGRGNVEVRVQDTSRGDGVDQIIADYPFDTDVEEYIWWTNNYHFTTNKKGEIFKDDANPDNINPIFELPFINFADDQDGKFWAQGGDDLADGSIKVNALLTNINHVAITQGYGQLYMTGKNLPKGIKVGPNHCIQLEYFEGDPAPEVGFLSANPPVADMQQMVEMYIAMLLTTNNLSSSSFSASLKGSQQFASGVAMLIDRSELIDDLQDQSQLFVDKEPQLWELISKWYEVYKAKGLLVDELALIKMPVDPQVLVAFPSVQPILSESDKLDILQKRKDMGLSTQIELLMRDDPSLTEETAQVKLDKIKQEKQDAMASVVQSSPQDQTSGAANGVQGNRVDGNAGQNNIQDRSVQ